MANVLKTLIKIVSGDVVGAVTDVLPKKFKKNLEDNGIDGTTINKVLNIHQKSLEEIKEDNRLQEIELTHELEMEELISDAYKVQTDLEIKMIESKDKYISRQRPTALYVIAGILLINHGIIPLLSMLSLVKGNIIILPQIFYDLAIYYFIGYGGFRTLEKTGLLSKIGKK